MRDSGSDGVGDWLVDGKRGRVFELAVLNEAIWRSVASVALRTVDRPVH